MARHLELAFNYFPPWAIPLQRPDGGLRLSGVFGSLVDNVTASLNYTYDATIPPDGLYGHKFENGTWSGMLGFLQRREADIAVGPFTLDYDIHTDHVLMPSCEYTFITAITGMKKAFETEPTPYTKAFEPITWMFMGLSILVLASVVILERYISGGKISFWSASSDLFVMVQTLLQEGTKDRFNYHFARLNGGIWILGTFILMQIFTQDLKANMVVKTPTMRINSLVDIVERQWLRIAYPIQSPIASILESTPGEMGDRVRQALKTRGWPRFSRDIYNEDILQEVRKSTMVIIMEDVSGKFQVSLWCKTTSYHYYMGFEGFWQLPAMIVLGKHVDPELREKIKAKIYQIAAQKVPFVRHMERYPGHFDCVPSAGNQRSDTLEALTMNDMEFPFVSHMIATTGCFVFFLVEVIWNKLCCQFGSRDEPGDSW